MKSSNSSSDVVSAEELRNKEKNLSRLSVTARKVSKNKVLLLMMLSGVIYYIIFHYIPMYGVIIAFKDFNTRLGIIRSPWIGFEQFIKFFTHPYFWRLLRNTFLLSFYSMIFGFPAPIILALLLNEVRSQAYKRTVQTISFLPHFIALPAIVGMLVMLLSPQTGMVNRIIGLAGIEPIYFMTESGWFRPLYIASGIWQNVGWGTIIYLAQLSRINPELYEAATVDGASRVRMMWHISLPGMTPMISIFLILRIGRLLSVGTEKVILMYNPATYEVADVLGSYVYRRGLLLAQFSYGAAVGLFNSVVSLILVLLANWAAKKVGEWSLF